MTARERIACALLAVLGAGCATGAPQPGRSAGACVVTNAAAAPAVRVAVSERVEPRNAPLPANGAERLVFAQLYETLVRIACDGSAVSGLAASWSTSDGGLTWTFRVHDGVTFGDGTPLDAASVAASFAAAPVPLLVDVSAAGDHELRVRLREARDVTFFAQPTLAITRADAGGWPHGTGPYTPRRDARGLHLVRRTQDVTAPDTLHILPAFAADSRDALDGGIDLLVSADPPTLAYARLLQGYATVALPWNRTYVLVAGSGDRLLEPLPAEREALARDAAPVGTRAAAAAMSCASGAVVAGTTRRPAGRIGYERGDEIARSIAERIAALAWPRERAPAWLHARRPAAMDGPLTAVALERTELHRELRAGRSAMLVVALPQPCMPTDPIHDALHASLLHVTPLVDARDHLVYRDGVGTITIDAAGTLRFGAVR